MNLEDEFTDIIKKARHGQRLSVADLAKHSGLSAGEITKLEQGIRSPSEAEVQAVAKSLGLRAGPLAQIAHNEWGPKEVPPSVAEIVTILGDIGGYEVKGYIFFDEEAREAALIDTGYNATEVLHVLDQRRLGLNVICLTHGHADHAGGLDDIVQRWPVPVYLGEDDRALAPWLPPAHLLAQPQDKHVIKVGRFTLECLTTPGHTPGGICYHVKTGPHKACFVGDTLFAGSIGRANPFTLYPSHLESVRSRVLTLPEKTLLFPGHGPATTVEEELQHNPFSTESGRGV